MTRAEAERIYGKPGVESMSNGMTILTWSYTDLRGGKPATQVRQLFFDGQGKYVRQPYPGTAPASAADAKK